MRTLSLTVKPVWFCFQQKGTQHYYYSFSFTWNRTKEISADVASTRHRASAGNDFESVPDGVAFFQNGSSCAQMTLVILNDSLPELKEIFQVVLTDVMVVGMSSSSSNNNFQDSANQKPSLSATGRELNITIEENDHPYGLFRLSVDLMQMESLRRISIREPVHEQKSLPVTVNIERTKGIGYLCIMYLHFKFIMVSFLRWKFP